MLVVHVSVGNELMCTLWGHFFNMFDLLLKENPCIEPSRNDIYFFLFLQLFDLAATKKCLTFGTQKWGKVEIYFATSKKRL